MNNAVKANGIVVKREEFSINMDHALVVEKMIKKFIKLCNREGVIQDCLYRRSYEKPSDKRRRKLKESINKRKQEENKRNKFGGQNV